MYIHAHMHLHRYHTCQLHIVLYQSTDMYVYIRLCTYIHTQVPYVSAGIDVTVCLCFVTNHISFHLATRVGGVGSDDANPTSQVCA